MFETTLQIIYTRYTWKGHDQMAFQIIVALQGAAECQDFCLPFFFFGRATC